MQSNSIEALLTALDTESVTREDLISACTFLNMVGGYGYTLQALRQETPQDIYDMCKEVARRESAQRQKAEEDAAAQEAKQKAIMDAMRQRGR